MVSARTLIFSLAATFPGMLCAQVNASQIASATPAVATETTKPLSVPPAPESSKKLSPEERGDVYMARKMYREAIESYREGGRNSAVLWDKIGIAYHQLGDLNASRKSYE